MSLLEVRELCFWYRISEPPIVYDCSFALQPNEFLAVVGQSGCGKSTLLRLCCGLIQAELAENPQVGHVLEGEVAVDGKTVARPLPEFAYVAQNFQVGLLPSLTAEQNVLLAVEEEGISPEESRRAGELLEGFKIADKAKFNVRLLSGGEQQRVAICRALVKQPKLLFMDEPFANLDPTLKPDIAQLLSGLRRMQAQSLALLLVTHDISHALALADRLVALRTGYGKPEHMTFEKGSVTVEDIVSWIGHT